ncbi:uncharacterized protein LOC142028305 [Buteo buteo]|uniref:uncharacterized protein LOC142028305 n=1 Tax=Buteo buteo TaxID=30397 RepID=UPI003EB8C8B7
MGRRHPPTEPVPTIPRCTAAPRLCRVPERGVCYLCQLPGTKEPLALPLAAAHGKAKPVTWGWAPDLTNGGRTPAPQAAATGMSILRAAARSCTFGSRGSPSSPCSCTGIWEIRNLLPLGLAGEAMGPGQSRGRPSPFLVPRSASAFSCQAFCRWTTGGLTLGLCTIPKRDGRPCSGKALLQGKAQLPSPPCSCGTPAQPPAPRH